MAAEIVIGVCLVLLVISIVYIVRFIRNAPSGYEDNSGFHYSDEE